MNADPELEKMLANPRFLEQKVFLRDQYLPQVTCGMLGHFLRVTNQPKHLFSGLQEVNRDVHSFCVKSGPFFAWGIELDKSGPSGISGQELYISKARPVGTIMGSPNMIREHVLGRDVVCLQAESDVAVPKAPPEGQIVQLKNIGLYVAEMILPAGLATAMAKVAVVDLPPLSPEMQHRLDHPRLVRMGATCTKDNYLEIFGRRQFEEIQELTFKPPYDRIQRTGGRASQMESFIAGRFGFYVFDLDTVSDHGIRGLDDFWSRVAEPVRRPPPELARNAMEQHIAMKEIVELRFDKVLPDGGIVKDGETRKVGWYVAILVDPQR